MKKYREQIAYLVCGGLTTVVNYVIYFICLKGHMSYVIANIFAWIGAVIFAYIVNKFVVFRKRAESFAALRKEIVSFFSARVATLVLEEVVMFVMIDLMHMNELIVKLIAQVLVIVGNYFLSKYIIFKKS